MDIPQKKIRHINIHLFSHRGERKKRRGKNNNFLNYEYKIYFSSFRYILGLLRDLGG